MSNEKYFGSGPSSLNTFAVAGAGTTAPPEFSDEDLEAIHVLSRTHADPFVQDDLRKLVHEVRTLRFCEELGSVDEMERLAQMAPMPRQELSNLDYLLIRNRAEAGGDQAVLTPVFRLLLEIDRLRGILGIEAGMRM